MLIIIDSNEDEKMQAFSGNFIDRVVNLSPRYKDKLVLVEDLQHFNKVFLVKVDYTVLEGILFNKNDLFTEQKVAHFISRTGRINTRLCFLKNHYINCNKSKLNCPFAHNIEELVILKCKNPTDCTRKECIYRHMNETEDDVKSKMKVNFITFLKQYNLTQ